MLERIQSIEDTTFDNNYSTYDGFVIVTDKQTIKMGISNDQDCCEEWGYLMSEDDIQSFVGANILGMSVVDDAMNVEKIKEQGVNPFLATSDCMTMFINIDTNRGTLQFVAYNEHNGYYGHSAVVVSTQLNHSEVL